MKNEIEALLLKFKQGGITDAQAEEAYQNLIQCSKEKAYDERITKIVKAVKNPNYRLFLFLPFGFGNESVAWAWKNACADDVEVWIIGSSKHATWDALVPYLAKQMAALCDIPFIVYGHCMGGIVAYEVLTYLEKNHQQSPHLFVASSSPTPKLFSREKLMSPFSEFTKQTDINTLRELLEKNHIVLPRNNYMKTLSNEGLLCDIELVRSYDYQKTHTPLSCPILGVQAKYDILVSDSVVVSLWKDYTKDAFLFEAIEGSHFYFTNPPASFFQRLNTCFCEKIISEQFYPGVYLLLAMQSGTEDMHIYPFGLNPRGILIYQEPGVMAAHLWYEPKNAEQHKDNKDATIERLLSYMCYSGNYEAQPGRLQEHVQVSSFPNFVDETLIRYYENANKELILRTAPITMKGEKQSSISSFTKLRCKKVTTSEIGSPIIGAWNNTAYTVNDKNPFEEKSRGVLIFTTTGYVSCVVAKERPARWVYDNPYLASDEEIIQMAESLFSFCGTFQEGENLIECTLLGGIYDFPKKKLKLKYHIMKDELELSWRYRCKKKKEWVSVVSRWAKF